MLYFNTAERFMIIVFNVCKMTVYCPSKFKTSKYSSAIAWNGYDNFNPIPCRQYTVIVTICKMGSMIAPAGSFCWYDEVKRRNYYFSLFGLRQRLFGLRRVFIKNFVDSQFLLYLPQSVVECNSM